MRGQRKKKLQKEKNGWDNDYRKEKSLTQGFVFQSASIMRRKEKLK
jgi:hypothetical protein